MIKFVVMPILQVICTHPVQVELFSGWHQNPQAFDPSIIHYFDGNVLVFIGTGLGGVDDEVGGLFTHFIKY